MQIKHSYFEDMKSLFQSRTFWLAVGQAFVAVAVIFTQAFPQADWVGGALFVKSVVDMWLRSQTTTPISSVLPQ